MATVNNRNIVKCLVYRGVLQSKHTLYLGHSKVSLFQPGCSSKGALLYDKLLQ